MLSMVGLYGMGAVSEQKGSKKNGHLDLTTKKSAFRSHTGNKGSERPWPPWLRSIYSNDLLLAKGPESWPVGIAFRTQDLFFSVFSMGARCH